MYRKPKTPIYKRMKDTQKRYGRFIRLFKAWGKYKALMI